MRPLRDGINRLRIALAFLTRLPVGRIGADDWMGELGRSAPLFPLAGLAVGTVVLAVDWLSGLLFGRTLRAVAAVAAGLWATGGLHLDGLMDTADALGSNRSRERMLEILKDSRVGAMGAAAGALSLLVRVGLLVEIPEAWLGTALLVAPALGRMAIALVAGLWPPARAEGGLGAAFGRHVGPLRAAAAMAVGLGVALLVPLVAASAGAGRLLTPPAAETLSAGLLSVLDSAAAWYAWLLPLLVRGLAAWVAALAGALLVARAIAARLGGMTGDTFGAICELAEMAALACFAALAGGGPAA